ncbi:hypothetical protein Mal64_24570 [Pseudobythopirellula maris]|uniref:Uncharacterized protein n=2 Tax=Pseudobythopirellula maris TaxID=2527991 RepID=A0A5C5ZP81_9BACT|nr:hypothetical protein Mal64_24570 [Pseudobythopirellula maris]
MDALPRLSRFRRHLALAVTVAVGLPFAAALPCAAADYAALAAETIEAYEPLTQDDLEAARSQVSEAAAKLERRLGKGSQLAEGWKAYLGWEGLEAQLTEGASPDLTAARQTLAKLGSGVDGLERREFQDLADALNAYIGVASLVGVSDQKAVLQTQLDAVVKEIARDPQADARASFEVERRLELFASAGVAQPLLAAVRQENGEPNMLLRFSESLLSRAVSRPVNRVAPVTDVILGTRIRGTGVTSGELSVDTLKADDHGRLRFSLSGVTQSQTVGHNGPVTIRSLGNTNFTASKVVQLRDRSFRVGVADADATTRSTTQSVQKTGGGFGARLIEKIARQKVAEKKSLSDAIAGQHAEARIAAQFDDDLTEEIRSARRRYDDGLSKPMRRRRAEPSEVRHSSTDDALMLSIVQAGEGQLAAPGEAPADPAEGDFTARLHQTAINNLAGAYVGGATITKASRNARPEFDVEMPEWLRREKEDVVEDMPEEGPEAKPFKPWAITLRSYRPISAVVRDGSIGATIHAARLSVGGENYDGWDLKMSFSPEQTPDGWRLVRQGEVEVMPTGFDPESGATLTSRQVALRSNLSKELNGPDSTLPSEFSIDTIELSDSKGSIDRMVMQELQAVDGWIVAAWRGE